MTLIDLFREFSAAATTDNYSGSSRILYYTLLYIWNERRRPSEVSVAQKQLYALTGLSPATFAGAVQYLSSRHWIKRLKSRNRTKFVYKLNETRTETERAAGFPLSRAQSSSLEEGRIALAGNSSVPTKEPEQHVQPGSSGEIGSSDVNTTIRGIQGTAATPTAVDSGNVPDDLWG